MGYAEYNLKIAELLPNENLEVCEENLHLFFQTMFERQEIYFKRFKLKKESPWTENEILRDYKFTNVYRELDRNSQYQIDNIFKKHQRGDSREELIWRIMFFRFFNNPEFFEFMKKGNYWNGEIIPNVNHFNSGVLADAMRHFRLKKGNPFTNAYLTNSQACPGWTRDRCFSHKVIPTLKESLYNINKVLIEANTPEDIIEVLKKLPSVADFMAHEFYQDFTYAPFHAKIKLMKFNQDDFTNVGPGAEVGIRLILPNRKTRKEKLQGIYDLRDLADDYLKEFGDFKYLPWYENKITLHQIEMWLCEFQKYWKMKVGEGKQRSKFIPKTKIK